MAANADNYWQRLSETSPAILSSLSDAQQQELKAIIGLSDFVATQLSRYPQWIAPLFEQELNHLERKHFASQLQQLLAKVDDEEQCKQVLRQYRNRQMVCIAWRDFMGYAPLEQSLLDLSALAEALVIAGRDWLYDEMCAALGTPTSADGIAQKLLVIGMGKLGGRELNFSSDIDLVFTFPEHGETVGGRRSIENQQFFIRMGQRLVNLLHQMTVDGFVYRVDMRLRPYGESGPLVVSFSGLEDYYQEQGRDWERYAMVKARALGPWTAASDELHNLLRPFVYRRYLDFSAIESLRKMKGLITQEVRRRKLTDNIKLGQGGIREVEFVVQSFQLIRGGREPSLRQQSLFAAIETLYQLGQIEYLALGELKDSYLLLRRVENLLQAINDEQTQTLPTNELDWQRLCWALDADNEMDIRQQIESAMGRIHSHFKETVGGNDQDDKNETWAQQLWNAYEEEHAVAILTEQGVELQLWPILNVWHETVVRRTIGPRGRQTLDRLMPKLLCDLSAHSQPTKAFTPVSKVLDQILTRTTYLELLCENPGARQQLISLCCASPWIAEQLANFPMLLDELIDPSQLYDTTSLDDYGSELRQYLLRVPEEDMEQQMEALRQFKLSQQLKIAAADVTGVLPVMQVSEHLTLLAEAIIEQVVQHAWLQISARHGVPEGINADEMGFAVVGYGKAGGLELGYGSDLDLVFLHNGKQGKLTNGKRSIDVGHFYLKLAQRILHLFSTRTSSGELYEVDMRLRPSGASGLLVSEIENFGDYQRKEAWTWEHQALVRARFMFGDNALLSQFNMIRAEVLESSRDSVELAHNVHKMRLKMREHLLKARDGMFDLKQSPGGIADIEFIAQYLVLANAHQYKVLAFWSDNARIFEQLAELGLIAMADAQSLMQAYWYLRDENHRLSLQQVDAILPYADVQLHADKVVSIYQQILT
ncbi:bifunctional [glutamate--ammonia ligase]-adenylyl-L-tyrosine phosphorylase/[glutamate--ammonia-ligase] adenylyltransferase [Shewanella youngdeokensis]